MPLMTLNPCSCFGVLLLFIGAVHSSVRNVTEDIDKTTWQLAHEYGYPCERHHVTTADGYILELHRIPHGRRHHEGGRRRPIVFLQHGIFDSSATWLATGPGNAFGYILADRGFDVWLGNSRGNQYSRGHKRLRPETSASDRLVYWNFSFHEIGAYDLPAMIRFALRTTGEKRLHYVGHSQGCPAFFVMTAERPEMNACVASMNGLGPAVFLGNTDVWLTRTLAAIAREAVSFYPNLAYREFATHATGSMISQVCQTNRLTQTLCSQVLFEFMGNDEQEFNSTLLPLLFGHTPSGGSFKQLVHFAQLIGSGRFCPYDYGRAANVKRYGTALPPAYALDRCAVHVTLHYGLNDRLVNPKDVMRLAGNLPQLDATVAVPDPLFTHLDFIDAIHAPELLYEAVIKVIRKYV